MRLLLSYAKLSSRRCVAPSSTSRMLSNSRAVIAGVDVIDRKFVLSFLERFKFFLLGSYHWFD
jgi:hypothetical protein